MYCYTKKDIIQDELFLKKEKTSIYTRIKDKTLDIIESINSLKTSIQTNIDKKKQELNTWYREYNWSEAGHKTARVLLDIWEVIYTFLPIIVYLSILFMTTVYSFIQFELAIPLRPQFMVDWIANLDKTTLPLLFQGKLGHPFGIFWLWVLITNICLGMWLFLIEFIFGSTIAERWEFFVNWSILFVLVFIFMLNLNNPFMLKVGSFIGYSMWVGLALTLLSCAGGGDPTLLFWIVDPMGRTICSVHRN